MHAYDPNDPGFTLWSFHPKTRLPTIETIMTQVAPGKKGIQAILEGGNMWWSGINMESTRNFQWSNWSTK